jgi:hypothetical protein
MFFSCNEDPKDFYRNDVKKLLIEGTVVEKYVDYNNHASTVIELEDSHGKIKKYIPFYFYGLYKAVRKDDSICKSKGSLEYRIFRKDTIIKLYPIIDGDTLK